MVFNSYNWRGKKLLGKIQLISFLGLYLTFPFLLTLLRAPEGGQVPAENIFIFVIIIVCIVFYALIMAYVSERILRIHNEKFAGRRVLAGSLNAKSGKGEEFEFIIYDMFAYETLPKYEQDAITVSEETMKNKELKYEDT
jgi:ACR3 family arsenite efflux pump ArsB